MVPNMKSQHNNKSKNCNITGCENSYLFGHGEYEYYINRSTVVQIKSQVLNIALPQEVWTL